MKILKIISVLWLTFGFLFLACKSQKLQNSVVGKLVVVEKMPSKYVESRKISIWLPPNYDKNQTEKYPILLLHDGQMLFDGSTTWNKQEWKVDETMTSLINNGTIKECIVVGIDNHAQDRRLEFFPEKVFNEFDESELAIIRAADPEKRTINQAAPFSDRYLKFCVEEVLPYVRTHFRTLQGKENTFVGGASMGGLVSMYAICEYPNEFGGAICMSTHWVGIFRKENNPIPNKILNYLTTHLPDAKDHKFYFDRGTTTLDALYDDTQLKVDSIMRGHYAIAPQNFATLEKKGDDHSEVSWAKRFPIAADFILGK